MPYLSASAAVIYYEEALYQVYVPLPLPLTTTTNGKFQLRQSGPEYTLLQYARASMDSAATAAYSALVSTDPLAHGVRL